MIEYLTLLFCFLCSFSFAGNIIEMDGKRYEILGLKEIGCIANSQDLFNPVSVTVSEEMTKAECKILVETGSPLDCAKISKVFLTRNFIYSTLRNKSYCDCNVGPISCVQYCKTILAEEECSVLCSGSCGTRFPSR